MRTLWIALFLAVVAACAACDSSLRATGVTLGRSVNVDETVAGHTTIFGPHDTVYVSIATAGVGSGVVSVRWMYAGRVIGEPKKEVSFRDVANTEFHLQSAGGFPPGEYTVEAFLDGTSVGSRTFRVDQNAGRK